MSVRDQLAVARNALYEAWKKEADPAKALLLLAKLEAIDKELAKFER